MPYTIPEYIEIKATDGSTVAFLSPESDSIIAWIDDEQNGTCTIEIELPLACEKWQYLTDQYRIYADGKEFVISNPDAVDKQRDGKKLTGKIKAHESWVLLGKKYQTISNDPQIPSPPWGAVIIVSGGAAHGGFDPGSAGSALSYLLNGTGWTVGTVDVTGTFDLETEKESVLYNINQVQEKWGGILIWDSVNKTVSLRDEEAYQPYTGYQIRYAKNLKGINRVDDYDIVTRLYPFGENDLNISAVNGGLLYLDNQSYSTDVLEGIWYNQDITDQTQLKTQGEKQLAKMCRPRHNYKTEVLDLRSLPGYGHETFKRSDMADLFDEEFGAGAKVRIIRYRHNVFQPWLCDMELGDPLEKIAASVAQSIVMAKFYKNVVAPNTSFQNLLKAIINTEATEINGASGAYTLVDGVSTWFDRDDVTGELTGKLLRITPQGLIISYDGGQTWKLAISGEGFHADAGWVGKLNAGLITVGPETTFAPGYDPTLIDPSASAAMGVDSDCLGLWHFDGSLNSHKGVAVDVTNLYTNKVVDGSITSLTNWNNSGTLITNDGAIGNTCVEYIYDWGCYQNFANRLTKDKYYFISAYGKITSGAGIPRISYTGVSPNSIYGYNNSSWHRFGGKVVCTDATINPLWLLYGATDGGKARLDGVMVNEISVDEYNNLTVEQLMTRYPFAEGTSSPSFSAGCFGQALNGSLKAPTTGLSPTQGTISFRAKNLAESGNGSVLVDLPKSDNTQGIKAGISNVTGHEGEVFITDSPKVSKSYTETTQADFNSGTLTDVVATSAGDLELAKDSIARTFEDDNTTNFSNVSITTAKAYAGTKSILCAASVASSFSNSSIIGSIVVFDFYIYVPTGTVRRATITNGNLRFNGGNLESYNGSSYVSFATYNADAWNHLQIANRPGEKYFDIYVNGTYYKPEARSSTGSPMTSLSFSVEGSDVYIDNFYQIGGYKSPGTREKIVNLSGANPAGGTKIEWLKTTPTNTTVKVETALSTDGGSSYGAYQEATSGSSIPDITAQTDLSNARLKIKETLSTTDTSVTPKLHSLMFNIWEKQATTVYGPNKSTLTAWDSISLAWKSERLSLVVNDTEACYIENPGLPSALGSYLYIGTDRNGANAINTLVDELRIDKVYRDVAIRTGWHRAGVPFYTSEDMKQWPGYLRAETDGLKVYDSENALRVLVGSWLKDAIRKYGIKIIDGEIYSSIVRSGAEDADTYIQFNPPNNLEVYYGGYLQMLIEAVVGGGIYFYQNGKWVGKISGATSNADIGLFALDTDKIGVAGNLDVNGSIYKTGSLNYVEPTQNYGTRLLNAVEAPELKYYDSGRATLVNGEATVYFDPIFLEVIEPDTELTPWLFKTEVYGLGEDIRVVEWGANFFRVKEENGGTSNRKFGWWFEATRINYAGIRLMEVVD